MFRLYKEGRGIIIIISDISNEIAEIWYELIDMLYYYPCNISQGKKGDNGAWKKKKSLITGQTIIKSRGENHSKVSLDSPKISLVQVRSAKFFLLRFSKLLMHRTWDYVGVTMFLLWNQIRKAFTFQRNLFRQFSLIM